MILQSRCSFTRENNCMVLYFLLWLVSSLILDSRPGTVCLRNPESATENFSSTFIHQEVRKRDIDHKLLLKCYFDFSQDDTNTADLSETWSPADAPNVTQRRRSDNNEAHTQFYVKRRASFTEITLQYVTVNRHCYWQGWSFYSD